MQQQRRLAAILFTDIVGYTALMQQNEVQAVTIIKKYHSVLKAVVGVHSGEILNDYGDGSLCTFPSAINALQAAQELQSKLKEDPVVPLRIGLHIGEIFFEDGKVFGDGVNVASRIQSLGQANTILFSGEINNKITNHPEFSTASLGRFEFKNVTEPIEVFALSNTGLTIPKKEEMTGKLKEVQKKSNRKKLISVSVIVLLLIAGGFIYTKLQPDSKFTGKERSIAVLPFASMNGDKETESFSIGISTEITNQLSRIGSLNVRASTSTIRFKDEKNKSLKTIAAELNVAAIVTGLFQKISDKIRVNVQLTDVNSDKIIWTKSFDNDWQDIFSIQNTIAEQVAFELNAEMTKDEKKKIEQKPTNNPEAYRYFLQGRHLHGIYFETQKPEYYERSKSMLEKALELDPNYALAHAGLADLYNTHSKTDSLIISLQLKEIEKAWKIDSTNDYISFVKGTIEQIPLRNLENAFNHFKRAIQINPNSVDNLWGIAMFLWIESGSFDESILLFNRVIIFDPLQANNYFFRGYNSFLLNKPENAIRDLEIALQHEPEFVYAMDLLAYVYASLNDLDNAKKMINKSFQLRPASTDHFAEGIAYIYAKLGNRKKALELAPDRWRVLLALGMHEEAIKAMDLKDVIKQNLGNSYLIFKSYLNSKDFELIRNDDRFLKIMESDKKQYEINKKKFNIAGILN